MLVNSALQSMIFVSKMMMTLDSTNVKLVLIMILTTGLECCYGYHISECGSQGKVDLDETRPAVLTCTGITDDAVYWNLDRPGRAGESIALCDWSNMTCTTVNSSWYEVTRTEYNTSTLTVKQSHRDSIAGTVSCGTLTSISAPCRVRVVRIADKVTNCSVTVNNTVKNRDWTVTASCDVEKMYASDGHYSCRWFVPDENRNETGENSSLSRTTFRDNDTNYVRGTCSISNLSMPTTNGIHNYDAMLNPGNTRLTGPRLEIKQPGPPKLFNCPKHVTEGDDGNCTCLASSSSPPAVTTWFTGRGDYTSLLQLRNVSRDMNGISYTCTQFWGGTLPKFQFKSTYTLRVTSKGVEQVPTTISKDNNTGDDHNDNTDDKGLSIPIIAGGTTGGLIVIVVIVVIVVFGKNRRRGLPQVERHTDSSEDNIAVYELPTRRSQVVDTNIYTGLDAQQQTGTSQEHSVYELPTRRSQVVDTNIYTGLDPHQQTSASQAAETTQHNNTTATGRQPLQGGFNESEPTDKTDYEIM